MSILPDTYFNIHHNVVLGVLKSLQHLDYEFYCKHGSTAEEELRKAISAVSILEASLKAGHKSYYYEREIAFKAIKAMKKSLSGRVDDLYWNAICLLEANFSSFRKADDCRF